MQLSIIIPAYNCADTIENAVASAAFCQDSEIIIIDDGSSDSTPEKINQLKEKHQNIKIVRQENSGPAAARNNGISIAQGKYVMFIDSDDTFEPEITKVLSETEKDTDMLIFGFRQNFQSRAEDKVYSLTSPFSIDEYYRNNLLNQVWNKVYRRDFINSNNIRFKDYRYGEDRIFNAEILRLQPVVKAIPDVLYNYNIDKNVSLISGYIPEKFDACKVIHSYYSALCSDKNVSNYMFLKNVLSCMTVLFAGNCKLTTSQKKQQIKNIIKDSCVIEAMKTKQLSVAGEIIRKVIATGNANLNYLLAFSVAFCQKHFLPLFLKFRK
ncbi:MAG: glycosyltransferase family 2 protein [Clostridia bacterium]|nr:glycosyltransferase family 2 protein [Clostridia bacterium]